MSLGTGVRSFEHSTHFLGRCSIKCVRTTVDMAVEGSPRQPDAEISICSCLTLLCTVQFTELQQKEQLAKLAMARTDLASAPSTRKFKFVSNVNEQVSPQELLLIFP